jgi:hypothetical protein
MFHIKHIRHVHQHINLQIIYKFHVRLIYIFLRIIIIIQICNFTVALSFDTTHAGGNNEGEAPKELLHFIEKQENYIEQLEKESNYCRVRLLI